MYMYLHIVLPTDEQCTCEMHKLEHQIEFVELSQEDCSANLLECGKLEKLKIASI